MKTFYILMTDECGSDFTETVQAADHDDAYDKARESWPEAQIQSINDPAERAERELDIYAAAMDDDYDYAEDY